MRDESKTVNVANLFKRMIGHVRDSLEPGNLSKFHKLIGPKACNQAEGALKLMIKYAPRPFACLATDLTPAAHRTRLFSQTRSAPLHCPSASRRRTSI